jgi:tungstate transport system permease protein
MKFLIEMLSQGVHHLTSGDDELWATTWRTLRLALGATAIAALFGIPLGVRIGQARPRVRRLGFVFANAGLGLPAVVLGVFVGILLLPASVLGFLHWRDTIWGVFLVQILFAIPILTALTATAVAQLPDGLLAQARAFGAGRVARSVLAIREARIGVITALMATLSASIGEVAAVVIVGGNVTGQTNTLTSTILLDLAASEPGRATGNALMLLLLVGLLGGALTLVAQRGRRTGAAA